MTTSDKLREIADMWGFRIVAEDCDDPNTEFETIDDSNKLFSDLTAIISEQYVAKEEVDKMVEERLREELIKYDKHYWGHHGDSKKEVDAYLEYRKNLKSSER